MGPTLVHVRGKRKQPSAETPKPVLELAAKKAKRTLASVMATRLHRHRPTLESLPAEILESILLYSSNFALPRASSLIGFKLSGRATLLRLFVWAFHETWHQGFGIPAHQHIFHVPPKGEDGEMPCHGDPVLQSAMLELPWVNIDFILQAQQVWADRYARHRWYSHNLPWSSISSHHQPNHDYSGGFSHFNARACFEADYQQALAEPGKVNSETMDWRARDVHPETRMPTELLTGPWDDEKLRRLYWLSRGGIDLDYEGQAVQPWEVKVQCLENAIVLPREPIALVANCLLGAWIFEFLPSDVMARLYHSLDTRMKWGDDSLDSRSILMCASGALSYFMQVAKFTRQGSLR
ncbi:hypothetical protein HIM_04950 [Hirsutella minnesotensis 3608]|uniref:Uncharacterized protein n=1 Tax=Hirsutella minnesotensis 3608 TaxID=1043627 RepID=A0A0F7ZV09_9HYPO|nr:hypothetical protein HIM_04950 [Hirsutella minnesotensis 3608]